MGALEAGFGFVPVVGVGLDVRVGHARGTEVFLRLSHLAASKEESVCAYYNFILESA